MRAVGIKTLKNKLSEYVRLAAAGETVLISDRDRISLTAKLMLTSNLAAVARRDAPLSTARTTRSRKSTEYGRAIRRWPPRPSSQFESQQPHVVNPKSIPPNRDPLEPGHDKKQASAGQ